MRFSRIAFLLLLLLIADRARSQVIPAKETFNGLTNRQVVSGTLPGPQHLRDYVVDGKLRLSLEDAVFLTLANNSGVWLEELNVETAKYALLGSHQPFDPLVLGSFNALRSTAPTFSQLSGAPTLKTLTQTTQTSYSQTLETGTNFLATFSASKLSSNSSNDFFNPSIASTVTFQLTQPLLRNRWLFANRAPLVIARRNLRQSRASFEAQVSDAILQAVTQYWNVVQARGNLEVDQKSLEAAEASYKHDKRALELGALPPLDIYRSESQVASRRVQLIQGEYALKQAEDALRPIIGADLDPYFRALDLQLTERPAPGDALRDIDAATALQQALARRPEFEAFRLALANDDTGIRLAHNNLLPDLRLGGTYGSNGLGGNQLTPVAIPGGLSDSLSQLFGFGFPTYGFSLTLSLPVKNRAAQADLGNALVSRRRDLYAQQQLREQVILDVSTAVHQLEQAKLSVEAGKEALDLAQKNVAAEQRKSELGAQPVFFVLEAQTELAQAESNLVQAEVGYQLSLAAVDHATGGLLELYHVKVADLTK